MSQDRFVIVTGGSRGLGLEIVKRLISDGFSVATCSRKPSAEMEAHKSASAESSLVWFPCELGNEDAENTFFTQCMDWAQDRRFYGLVNNAAVARDGVLATLPTVEIERLLQVNLLSALRMSRLALRHLLSSSSGGRIVNISSIVGIRGYTGLAAYAASKAGLDGMTRALAREVGRRQITINSVAPGYLETDMSASLEQSGRQQIVRRTPLGRLGTVADIAPVVSFLLSDEASFMTGQTVVVDGGITC